MLDNLREELQKKNKDWTKIEEEIKTLENINWCDFDDETILSGFYHDDLDGKDLLKLTELFLKNGYDVKANERFNGYSPLHWLCWSCYDRYILEIAEMLLDAGADPNLPEFLKGKNGDNDTGVIGDIAFKFGNWYTGEWETANLMEAYYEMVEAFLKGESYKGIRAVDEAYGKIITSVQKITRRNEDKTETSYVIWCGSTPLIVSEYIEFIVNPYTPGKAETTEDISEDCSDLIGREIKGLTFISPSSAILEFTDGSYAEFFNDTAFGTEEGGEIRISFFKEIKESIGSARIL